MNRYRINRDLSELVQSCVKKYKLDNDCFKVIVKVEKHLSDRIIDRRIGVGRVQYTINMMFRKAICQLIYSSEAGKKKIVLQDHLGYCIGLTVTNMANKVYCVKLRTTFHRDTEYRGQEDILIQV